MPTILTRVIDDAFRNIVAASNDAALVGWAQGFIKEISQLKYQIVSNKKLKPLQRSSTGQSYYEFWDSALKTWNEKGLDCWLDIPWLFVECYMYAAIWETIRSSSPSVKYDPFQYQKLESLQLSIPNIELLASLSASEAFINETWDYRFKFLLYNTLWGNKADLSLITDIKTFQSHALDAEKNMEEHILTNESDSASAFVSTDGSHHIEYVLDNAGMELFSDLLFAAFLIETNKCNSISFHVKEYPWFVSDATIEDIWKTLDTLQEIDALAPMVLKWKAFVNAGIWTFESNKFWHLPHSYWHMETVAPELHARFKKAGLVVWKGDLNYRKLVYDGKWELQTPLLAALGPSIPTNYLVVRTLKSNTLAGFEQPATSLESDWMVSGKYGVIQFVEIKG